MKTTSARVARKKEESALEAMRIPQPMGPPCFADDLDGMGEAWMGLLEEEDTLSNMQDWEQK